MRATRARAVLAVLAIGVGGCADDHVGRAPGAIEGDVRAGVAAMERYGCAACHTYPGADGGAEAYVGPPLDHWSQRSFVAGLLPNNQPNLEAWLMGPERFRPGTAMPDLGVTQTDARDIAAYLLSLR